MRDSCRRLRPATSSTSTGCSPPTPASRPPRRSRSAPPGTAARRSTAASPRPTSSRSAPRSAAYRAEQGITGPLFLGRDTHALSEPAFRTIVEVLAAHGVDVVVDAAGGFTPTPVISHAILTHNRGGSRRTPARGRRDRRDAVAQPARRRRLQVQPAARRPRRTPTSPAGSSARRTACSSRGSTTSRACRFDDAAVTGRDYVSAYVDDLASVIDLDAIRRAGIRLGVDPLGGASVAYWQAIRERHGLDLEIVNDEVDPTFRFVPLDWDGKIRMDCSSPYAMGRLRELADRFDVAFANDPDADRHGIVTPAAGLLNPNHHLAACIAYLFGGHRDWGRARRHRQDARQLLDHRPRRGRPRAAAGRGPGRVQVVRRGAARRDARVRRRGERGRLVPAPRRQRLEHRQGRADPVPARGGDEGHDRQGPGRALRRAGRALRARGLQAHRRRRQRRGEGRAQAALARAGAGATSWPASRSRRC